MALDDTIGGASSNSYVSEDEANTYFADRLHAEDWDVALDPDKALMTASSMLDWYLKWKGVRASETQALDWPRSDVIDENAFEVSETIIPVAVKIATYEMALIILDEDRTSDQDLDGFSEVKVGPLFVKSDATHIRTSKPKVIPDKIKHILDGLTVSGIGTVGVQRLMRA